MIKFSNEFFNIEDTLYSGQVFRFIPYKRGYLLRSLNKTCYLYNEGDFVCLSSDDDDYFYNYFDLKNDYSSIYRRAFEFSEPFLKQSAISGKGIRILNQSLNETLFSFIVSQNNNIPRIKKTIENICIALGEKTFFMGDEGFAFPSVEKLSKTSADTFKELGLGYRAEYFVRVSNTVLDGSYFLNAEKLSTNELRNKLIALYGVGEKVADCVLLFGFHRTDSFPVDTWVEKFYKTELNGKLTDRKKISKYFTDLYKEYSGYFQQYMFYYKRGK